MNFGCSRSPGRLSRLAFFLCLAGLMFGAARDGFAERKLYLVIAADIDDPELKECTAKDSAAVEGLFHENVPRTLLQIVQVAPENLDSNGMIQAINGLPVTDEDAVVFYYSGHGAYGQDNRHVFVTKQGTGNRAITAREDVIASLKGKGAGLTVLITDACFNFSKELELPHQKFHEFQDAPQQLDQTRPLFNKLFFETDGFLDLNACQKGEVAGVHDGSESSSIFTTALTGILRSNSSMPIEWSEILDQVSQKTKDDFEKMYGATDEGGKIVTTPEGDQLQRTQTMARLAVELQPRVNGQPPPPVPPLPTRPQIQRIIDPCDGDVYEIQITRRFNAETGVLDVFNTAHRISGKAELVTASDGSEYWIEGILQPSIVRRLPGYDGACITSERLGVTVRDCGGRGAMVIHVVEGGPATHNRDAQGQKWFLTFGDIITQVNGQQITTVAEFAGAIANSDAQLEYSVRDGDFGPVYTFGTTLHNAGTLPNPNVDPIPPLPPVPNENGGKGTRFGAYARDYDGAGVEVTGVVPNSPATRLRGTDGNQWYLEAGDSIVEVNGKVVQNYEHYRQLIQNSPRRIHMKVIGGRDGESHRFNGVLNY